MKRLLVRQLSGFYRCTSGAALVEATLVVPIAIALMVGIVDCARAYMAIATAQKSLRDATRYLTILPANAVCDWGLTRAKNVAVYGNISGTGVPLVHGWVTGDISRTAPANCAASFNKITLSANVPFTALTWQVVGLPTNLTFNVQHEERWIGQ
jgi:Flp pilus assembly protein TadG